MSSGYIERAVEAPPFEVAGPTGAPLIVVMGGVSATKHVCAHAADPAPGWWDAIVGDGKVIDTRRFRVASFDYLDGGRNESGRPARAVTTHDQAHALARVLDTLGDGTVPVIVGASYGGMVALAFAERYPERVDSLIVIGAAHEPHPMSIALRSLQRRIVELGIDTGRVREALSIARGLAMTTYRSAREFGERFSPQPVETANGRVEFASERYLRRHGHRFAETWTAERFLALSLSNDLHRVDPTTIRARTLLIAPEGDAIVPRAQVDELARLLPNAEPVVTLPSRKGHDAFLTEPVALGNILARALNSKGLT